MASHEFLALLGADSNPQLPGIILGERPMSRGEVWKESAALAGAIELQVPSGYRTGLVDTAPAGAGS